MTNDTQYLTVFSLISFLVLPQYAYANALTNGDFETPDQGNSFSFDIPAGSTFITGWGAVIRTVEDPDAPALGQALDVAPHEIVVEVPAKAA